MQKSKLIPVVFVALVLCGVSVYYSIQLGLYPIAVVNGRVISAGRFDEAQSFIRNYYQKAQVTYSIQGIAPGEPGYENEIARVTLDKLIGDTLIYAEVKSVVGKELGSVVEQKIKNAKAEGLDFAKAVETIYGLTLDRFHSAVLVPQAWEEVLRGRMFADSTDFDAWFLESRKQAKVVVLHPSLTWEAGQVVIRDTSGSK